MSDIRDIEAFIRGRWKWTSFGYERGFPRGCQFTDVDAATEFDDRSLNIEAKHFDGIGDIPKITTGQRLYLRREALIPGRTVLILYGCATCNDPFVVEDIGTGHIIDLRDKRKPGRRAAFKDMIDRAMGLWEDA
jgi:hypothetical protein